MAAFIAKQPNGLYCRFSSVVDCPTHWNMTEEDYVEYCAERAREEARNILKNNLKPFTDVIDSFVPVNMSDAEFEEFLQVTSENKEENRNECQTESKEV